MVEMKRIWYVVIATYDLMSHFPAVMTKVDWEESQRVCHVVFALNVNGRQFANVDGKQMPLLTYAK